MQLTAENLACERGGRTVFSNQNFSLGSGELLQLTGPNGSGKSSLLRLLASLSEPSHGKISLEGGAPDLTPGQQAHYIAHSDASKSALTVTENLKFWRDFIGGGDLMRALQAVNLSALADYPVALLSAGQKRRLALARLALVPRAIWLLDEPSVGLDEAAQKLLGRPHERTSQGRRAHCCRNPCSAWTEPRQKSPPRGSAMKLLLALLRRDLILAARQGGGAGTALGFFLTVLVLLPIGIGPDQATLQRLAPGILWITLLLSVLLSADRIFQQDFEDGSLEVMAMAPPSLELVALTKAVAHWLSTSLPLSIAAPFLGILLNLQNRNHLAADARHGPGLLCPFASGQHRRIPHSQYPPRRLAHFNLGSAALCARPRLRHIGHNRKSLR